MKRAWLLLLAGMLMASSASAQAPARKQADEPQEKKASSEQSDKKGAGAKASSGASASASTSASAQAGQNSANLAAGTTFEAALSGSLDARKNKEGDQVVARTTQAVKSDGQVVVPKGCKLVGHVTQAKARGEGESQSALGIVFDRALFKDGREMPIHVVIQALASAQAEMATALDAGDGMVGGSTMGGAAGSGRVAGSGGGVLGGVGSTVGAAAGTVTNTAGAVGSTAGGAVGATTNTAASATGAVAGRNAAGMLTSSSTGVIGLKGLSLNSEASNATQGSLIVSSTRNVHLDSGTRMLLRAAAQ